MLSLFRISRPISRAGLLAPFLPLALVLTTGCALQQTALPSSTEGNAFGGKIMGGQQPVSGASIRITTVATNGYDQTSNSAVAVATTDANGNYSFPTGSYTCPSATTPILIEALGGNPGLAAGTNNSAIFLVAYAGPCGALNGSTFIIVNEVTTVAAAYVLRPFMNGSGVSTSSTNLIGLTNAFATYNNLVNNRTGLSPGAAVPAGVVVPSQQIHSLANSLAACVNTTAFNSSNCSSLFFYANVAGSGAHANTFEAAAAIATTPTRLVSNIYSLGSATPPFANALSSAPPDWSVVVTHTSGTLNDFGQALDIDPNGNVWVGSDSFNGSHADYITNAGASIARGIGSTDFKSVTGVVTTSSGSVYITANDSVLGGIFLYGSDGTLNYPNTDHTPKGLSSDGYGNLIFVEQHGSTVVAEDPSLSSYNSVVSSFTPTRVSYFPGNASYYVSNNNGNTVEVFSKLDGTGTRTTFNANAGDCHFVFAPSSKYYCVTPNTSTLYYGSTISPGGTSSYPMFPSVSGQVDGTGQLWLANQNASASLPFRAARLATPATSGTYSQAGVLTSFSAAAFSALQIDGSGNVWITNGLGGGLTELVGAAAPTYTPKSIDSNRNTYGTRP